MTVREGAWLCLDLQFQVCVLRCCVGLVMVEPLPCPDPWISFGLDATLA